MKNTDLHPHNNVLPWGLVAFICGTNLITSTQLTSIAMEKKKTYPCDNVYPGGIIHLWEVLGILSLISFLEYPQLLRSFDTRSSLKGTLEVEQAQGSFSVAFYLFAFCSTTVHVWFPPVSEAIPFACSLFLPSI